MLHRVCCVLFLSLGVPAGASAQGGGPGATIAPGDLPRAPLTMADQAALQSQLEARVVEVRRLAPDAGRYIVPGGVKPIEARGWVVAKGRVVTASAAIRGWPAGPDDRLEVKVGAVWRPAAVGITESLLGLAVLDVPGLPAEGVDPPPEAGAVYTGRPLYFVDGGRMAMAKVGIAAAGQRAYYVWLEGAALPLGTPLFDGRARVITLVGLDSLEAPGRSLVLPDKALREIFERKIDWLE